MADELPEEFDVILLGTGFPESVVAASLSRVGLKVLHLDRNDYYSGQWVTFTFDTLLKWIECNQAKGLNDAKEQQDGPAESGTHNSEPPSLETGTYSIPVPGHSNEIRNVVVKSYFSEKQPQESVDSEPVSSETAVSPSETQKLPDSGETNESESCDEKNDLVEAGTSEEPNTEDNLAERPLVEVETAGVSDLNRSDSTLQSEEESENAPSEVKSAEEASNGENEGELPTESDSGNLPEVPFVPPPRQRNEQKPAIDVNMTFDDLKPYWRRFNIDISPKLLFSRGPLVEALISANISHYAEFKAVTRILTYMDGRVEEVPCSRADVFSSSAISVVEKRMLMKYLTFCLDFEQQRDQYEGFEDKPYSEFLQSRRLTPNLQHFIIHAIAMVKPETVTVQGLKATQSFLQSLGRYGNTPFIWPLYGAGELPQAFCRMCAVFGGLYCLRRGASAITVSEANRECTGVISEKQALKCKWLITEFSYVPEMFKKECTQFVSRAIFITCSSLKASDEDHITVLSVPPSSEGGEPVRVIELGPTAMACPKGLYVVHLVSKGLSSAKDDLEPTADKLFHFPSEGNVQSDKPTVLWSLYFNQAIPDSSCVGDLPSNVHVMSLPGTSIGFGEALQQAREVFEKICPDEEFLQPVPNPEDIILDDFLQDGNQNAAQPDLGGEADDADPASGEETPALGTEQEQAEGNGGSVSQPNVEESPVLATEQEQFVGESGASSQPSEEESPVLAMEQDQAKGESDASSQQSGEESQSGTGGEPSDS
ncbi:hypothetical protein ACROYT_G017841 [Oculina patagonica]